jgi:Domain of unknown function (DUF4351)
MSELKRYWVVIHYETELAAENEEEACFNIRLGNTIVEEAAISARELPADDGDCRESLEQARIEARREAAIAIIVKQLCHRMKDYTLLFNGLPADLQTQLDRLTLEQLENLSIEALQFSTLDDLRHFLN